MKRIKTFVGMLCAAAFVMGGLLSTSCKKDENPGDKTPEVKEPVSFTVAATASYYTAQVTGTVSEIVEGAEYGVVYGTAEKPEVGETTLSKTVEKIAEDKTFTLDLTELAEGTTYHYRAYICEKGAYTYSDDATFVTKAFPVVTISSAEYMNGGVTFKFSGMGESIPSGYKVGVQYSRSESFAEGMTESAELSSSDYDGQVFKKSNCMISLFITYYYRSYVEDSVTGDVKYYGGENTVTSDVTISVAEPTISGGKATFNISVVGDDGFGYKNNEANFGLLVSSSSSFDGTTEGVKVSPVVTNFDNNFNQFYESNVEGLTSGTYYYRVYYKQNNEFFGYTDIKSFTIE